MTKPFRSIRGLLSQSLAGLIALVSFCALPARADENRATVWSIRGANNTVYLAGSVHALPKEHSDLPPALERAYAESESLLMEVDLDDMNPLEAVQFISQKGTFTDGRSLGDLIDAQTLGEIQKTTSAFGMPEAAVASMEPWAAAMILTQFGLMKSGYEPSLGIDMQLLARAKEDKKPIEGLETLVEQLSIFDDRSMDEQVAYLKDAVRDMPKMSDDLARLVDGWRRGDLSALQAELEKERATAPELYDELLGARNRRWVPKIEALLDRKEDVLVVVGAMHFVGKDGLLELLAKEGHKPKLLPAPKAAKK
jgi:uncharacterized protein YbaP (TraB family)